MATTAIPKAENIIGAAVPRIDGPLKTTGTARYAVDHDLPNVAYGVAVTSTIGKGRIKALDATAAEKMPGVLLVYHHGNMEQAYRVAAFDTDKVTSWGQYVALVVAETFEQAKSAAAVVRVEYDVETPDVRTELWKDYSGPMKSAWKRGDPDEALKTAPVTVDEMYVTPVETHNPMEMHGLIAAWDGDHVTLYDSTQAVVGHKNTLANWLGLPKENVRVISRFIGSGFGSKLFAWPHSALAAVAAKKLERPVKLSVDRRGMFAAVGHRPRTQQRIRLGATQDGKLLAIRHDYLNHTSINEDRAERCAEQTPFLYSCANLETSSALVRRNVGSPAPMRGPGAVPGIFALESAMDELAWKLKMNPLELRLKNDAKIDEGVNLPFSSRHLKECFEVGAEKIGWKRWKPEIGGLRGNGSQAGKILGLGMAAASWSSSRERCNASVELCANGRVCVRCATQDIGTGTYTLFAQVAYEKTGVPLDRIDVFLGDSSLPDGPTSGGSRATSALLPAALYAVNGAMDKLLAVASGTEGSPFYGMSASSLMVAEGRVHAKQAQTAAAHMTGVAYKPAANPPAGGVPFAEILKLAKLEGVTGTGATVPSSQTAKDKGFSQHSFGAQFVEVEWEPEIARLRVNKIVSVYDCGRIINKETAENQMLGAVMMGLGMSLMEETIYDERTAQPINGSFADYLVPTCADLPEQDVTFLDYPDPIVNEYGARGVGEIGLAGVAPAIASAVYQATGIRVRELPIRIEDLLQSRIV
jgi:xanthine dehydrogenase YagR molybdenum-binding subunit